MQAVISTQQAIGKYKWKLNGNMLSKSQKQNKTKQTVQMPGEQESELETNMKYLPKI